MIRLLFGGDWRKAVGRRSGAGFAPQLPQERGYQLCRKSRADMPVHFLNSLLK